MSFPLNQPAQHYRSDTSHKVFNTPSTSVAVVAVGELRGERRAWIPLALVFGAYVLLWVVSADQSMSGATLARMSFVPILMAIVYPSIWRWIVSGTIVGYAIAGAADLTLQRAGVSDVLATHGALAAASVVVVAVMAGITAVRMEAEEHRSSLVHMSRTPTIQLSYHRVLDRFRELRKRGVSDLSNYLEDDPIELAKLVSITQVKLANEAASQLYARLSPEETSGRLSLPTGMADAIRRELVALWEGHTELDHEYPVTGPDGRVTWLQQSWPVVLDEDRPDFSMAVLNTLDISALKEAEAELGAQIEAKDEFIASISHELRTPLSAVVGFAAELRDGRLDDLDGEEVSELVALIADQSAEVSNIVEDLLVAARLDSQTLTIMPRTINVDETIHAVAPLVPRKIYANGLTALADPHRVRQILRNLFANPDHSRVRLVGWCRWMVWVVVWRWLADLGVSRVWWCRGAGSGGVGAWLFHGRRSGLERGAGQVRAATCR